MFDRIYTSTDAGFSLEPNDLVVRTAAGRPAGSAPTWRWAKVGTR